MCHRRSGAGSSGAPRTRRRRTRQIVAATRIQKAAAFAHVELLWELATGPSGAGREEELQRATFALRIAAPTPAVTAQTNHAEKMLALWLSPRTSKRWSESVAHVNAVRSVRTLRSAIDADWMNDVVGSPWRRPP